MIGRSNVVQGDPAKVDAGIAFVRDRVQPLVDSLPGSRGLGMWVNRETGVGVVSTAWEDRAALDASEQQVTAVRAEAAAAMGASNVRVEVDEPVIIWQKTGDEPGFWVRSIETSGPMDRIDEGIALCRDEVLPALQQFPGISGVALLVNRDTGHWVLNVTYRSRADMEANRERGQALRDMTTERLGMSDPEVTELEVAIVGIRGPEIPQQREATAEQPRSTPV